MRPSRFGAESFLVDEILGAIDVLSSEQPIKYNNEREHSHFIGGFGVFDSTKSNNNEVHINHDTVEKDLSSSQEANQSLSPPSDLQFTDFTCALESNHTSVTQPTAPTGTLVSADERGTAQSSFTFSFSDVLDLMPDAENTAVDQDQYDSYISRNDIGDESPQHNLSAIFSPTIPRPPRPVHLTENEHLLIHYYTTKVVHIFPALDSPKSPWKTFHLPRVLQSIAEMAVQGSSSLIRAALRSTLLSVSAFFLSKHMRTQSQIEQSTKWETEAMRFHGTGMRLLKESVNAKFASQERPKYKEFLATMLSMVSINVMSGDVASCSLHLKAASKLITETSKWKTNYSNKAVALHRIYFYLSTIYDSTNVRVASTSGQLPDELDMTSPESHRFGSIEDTRIPTSPAAGFYDPKNVGAYESIYAIPKDLLVLLAKTTELINLITDAREESGDRQIPPALAERCDELEASIMNWQAEPQPPDISSSPIANPNIIYNMTRAFHKAIIIFFAQNVGLLGHWYLRHFVEEVINSIEAVEHIKIEWQVSASPLYWPAFIAASEAFDRGLQDRFKAWYAQVEPKAIGSINTAIRLLQDVWAEGPSTLSHKTRQTPFPTGVD
ncbi:hypothetical protein N7456_007619 [Penicillium angulare]|uniref:Transcription factor n=1 Tax=Penicillium angulare TaxID=116970 RepID=A0A9W9K8E7_9EURO|nr:hypothetical protein N7456_007619 [Penicillium angulare]